MSILKLQIGAPITMNVKDVRVVDGQFGPQYAFDSVEGDTLFLGRDTVERQAERLGGVTKWAGHSWQFEKVQKGTKTFINIDPAKRSGNGGTGAGAAPKANGNGPTGREQSAPRPASGTLPAVQKAFDADVVEYENPLYLAITRFVQQKVDPLYGGLTNEEIKDVVAVLYIQEQKRS